MLLYPLWLCPNWSPAFPTMQRCQFKRWRAQIGLHMCAECWRFQSSFNIETQMDERVSLQFTCLRLCHWYSLTHSTFADVPVLSYPPLIDALKFARLGFCCLGCVLIQVSTRRSPESRLCSHFQLGWLVRFSGFCHLCSWFAYGFSNGLAMIFPSKFICWSQVLISKKLPSTAPTLLDTSPTAPHGIGNFDLTAPNVWTFNSFYRTACLLCSGLIPIKFLHGFGMSQHRQEYTASGTWAVGIVLTSGERVSCTSGFQWHGFGPRVDE